MDHATIAGYLSSRIWSHGIDTNGGFRDSASTAESEGDNSRLLELAYEEYCQRASEGEEINASLFCKRFPPCRSSLARRLMIHELLNHNSDVLESVLHTPWPESGDNFLRFSLIEELGRGATSRVFLAEEVGLGSRRVVVKISHAGGCEAEILGKLSHPNIVPVHSVEHDPSSRLTAICMPYLCDTTVHDFIDIAFGNGTLPVRFPSVTSPLRETHRRSAARESQPSSPAKRTTCDYVNGVLEIVAQMFDALAHTHECGILHLDLKPSNILITPDAHPFLLDFNLSADRTFDTGLSGGTLPYMSPEQIQAAVINHGVATETIDERSDIYSMGLILHQLLTGVHPFDSIDWQQPTELVADELLERQQQPLQSPRRLNPNVDATIERFIQDCLACDPSDRPKSAVEAGRAVRQSLSPRRRTARWSRAHRKSTAAILILLVVITLGLGHIAYSWATQPSHFEYLLAAGHQEFESGNHQQAVVFFDQAIDLDSTSAKPRFARGRARLAVRNFSSAFEDFCEAERLSPDPMNLAYAAVCQQALGDQSQARFYYNEAIHAGLQNAAIWNNLGVSYSNGAKLREEHDRADDCFRNAILLEPSFQIAWLSRAENRINSAAHENDIEHKMQRMKLAITHVNEALDIGPRTPIPLLLAASGEGMLAVYCQAINDGQPTDASREAFAQMLDYYDEVANQGVNLATSLRPQQWKSISPDETSFQRLEEIVNRNPRGLSIGSHPRVFDPENQTPLHGI